MAAIHPAEIDAEMAVFMLSLSRSAALLTRPALPTPAPRCSAPVLRAGDTNLWSAVPWSALTNCDPIAIVEAQLAYTTPWNLSLRLSLRLRLSLSLSLSLSI